MKINGIYFSKDLPTTYTLPQFIARFQHLWPKYDADTRQKTLATAYELLSYANSKQPAAGR